MEEAQTAAEVGGWEIDLATNQLHWTSETYRIHETSPADYSPSVETAIRFYTSESIPLITAAVQDGIAHGIGWDLELELITARKRRIWARAIGKTQSQDGRVTRVYGAIQNITASPPTLRVHVSRPRPTATTAARAQSCPRPAGSHLIWINPASANRRARRPTAARRCADPDR